MNWNNLGKYSASKWDNNDPKTWRWQVDHIIPYSDLPYTAPTDENFVKLWSLDNLRPLCAKQNVLDGSNRKRHKSPKKVRVIYIRKEKVIPKEDIDAVTNLYLLNYNRGAIAKELGFSVHYVRQIYEKYNVGKIDRSKRTKENAECLICKQNKSLSSFRKRIKDNKDCYESYCLDCEKEKNKQKLRIRYQEFGRQHFLEKYKDPVFREEHLKQYREWYAKNRKK